MVYDELLSIDSKIIECPISNERVTDPCVAEPCGHLFDKQSITTWFEQSNACPICRIGIVSLVSLPWMKEILNTTNEPTTQPTNEPTNDPTTEQPNARDTNTIRCLECFEYCPIETYESHLRVCENRPIACKNRVVGCEETPSLVRLVDHTAWCDIDKRDNYARIGEMLLRSPKLFRQIHKGLYESTVARSVVIEYGSSGETNYYTHGYVVPLRDNATFITELFDNRGFDEYSLFGIVTYDESLNEMVVCRKYRLDAIIESESLRVANNKYIVFQDNTGLRVYDIQTKLLHDFLCESNDIENIVLNGDRLFVLYCNQFCSLSLPSFELHTTDYIGTTFTFTTSTECYIGTDTGCIFHLTYSNSNTHPIHRSMQMYGNIVSTTYSREDDTYYTLTNLALRCLKNNKIISYWFDYGIASQFSTTAHIIPFSGVVVCLRQDGRLLSIHRRTRNVIELAKRVQFIEKFERDKIIVLLDYEIKIMRLSIDDNDLMMMS